MENEYLILLQRMVMLILGNKKGKILQSLQVIVKGNACIFNITS